ncbi:MAG: hypothetical protein VKL39_01870 [Leptolyngbyaceae bacterium]|nr:hypothetical protein [Leptolyngbyaceae bacterium]
MNWEAVGVMVAISVAVSSAMIFVVQLMMRATLSEATSRLTKELHDLLNARFVTKDVYDRDLKELRRGMKWLYSEIEDEEGE